MKGLFRFFNLQENINNAVHDYMPVSTSLNSKDKKNKLFVKEIVQ